MQPRTVLALAAVTLLFQPVARAQRDERPRLSVRPTADFDVTGAGDNAAWRQAEWVALRRREPDGHPYDTRFKAMYSGIGMYVLIEGTDRTLTATMNEDFMDLWNEDVFEVFLWTDERYPAYFEYEISPLGHELPILQNVPPKPGTTWCANVYRMDYDEGKRTQWEWAHVQTGFHEYERFGDLVFADR